MKTPCNETPMPLRTPRLRSIHDVPRMPDGGAMIPQPIQELALSPVMRRRLAEEPRWYPDPIVEIVSGLLEMRRAGALKALYVDRSVIRIGTGGHLARLELYEAVRLIESFRTMKKPMGAEAQPRMRARRRLEER